MPGNHYMGKAAAEGPVLTVRWPSVPGYAVAGQ
jgi:hypothetical protein